MLVVFNIFYLSRKNVNMENLRKTITISAYAAAECL